MLSMMIIESCTFQSFMHIWLSKQLHSDHNDQYMKLVCNIYYMNVVTSYLILFICLWYAIYVLFIYSTRSPFVLILYRISVLYVLWLASCLYIVHAVVVN